MRMFLRADYPNGFFGDPALYLWDITGKPSLLFDCGDLSRFTVRQLLRVGHVFLSHCHMDHFFGFDHLLRVHIGSEKLVEIYGPPDTSLRVAGKLQGYTWNLVSDQKLEFRVHDLDLRKGRRSMTRFSAQNGFRAEEPVQLSESASLVVDLNAYRVQAVELDHHTPSLAYSVEEKPKVSIDAEALRTLGLKPGPWIERLKWAFLFHGSLEFENGSVEVPLAPSGERGLPVATWGAAELARKILVPRQRFKLAYATDGAASAENRSRLLELVRGADLFFAETCFLERDRRLADETRHFTARFMGELAREAGVGRILPFHFSKRYVKEPEEVLAEVDRHFLSLPPPPPIRNSK